MLLHVVLVAMLLTAANTVRMPETIEALTWLNLPRPETPSQKPKAETRSDDGKADEQVWTMPAIAKPDVEIPPQPDFPGLGRMLNNCRLENFSYLSNLEQQRCAGLMAQKPRLAPNGTLPKPYRAQDQERWARERAEQKKPKTLPCFGEGGFNPLSPGCLSPAE